MFELAWVVLLAFAYSDKRVRLLADLLVAKWALSYFVFLFVGEWTPLLTDLAVGTVLIPVAIRQRRRAVAAPFVLFPVAHGIYQSTWSAGLWLPVPYYWTLSILYTLLVVVLCPWEKLRARHRTSRPGRFGLALAAHLGFGPRSRARRPG